MTFDVREREKFRLRSGDLLVCVGHHVGRCAIWRSEIDECYYQKTLFRLRPISSELTAEYMQYFMMLRFLYQPGMVTEVDAISRPYLTREKLIALPIWYPPRPEQDEIVAVLDSLAERERAEKVMIETLHDVKNALMSVLLAGELRVTPDETAATR